MKIPAKEKSNPYKDKSKERLELIENSGVPVKVKKLLKQLYGLE